MSARVCTCATARTPEFERYWEASPVAHVSPDDAPFLLIHGDADIRVPVERSVEFQDMLQKVGVEAKRVSPAAAMARVFRARRTHRTILGRRSLGSGREVEAGERDSAGRLQDLIRIVERDVVFGMVSWRRAADGRLSSGEAKRLRGNPHYRQRWHTSLAPGAAQQKATPQVKIFGQPLVDAGYTVFAVNHRTASFHKYPAQVVDVQRAVRFVRHKAARWVVNPKRDRGVGGSSGGHLTAMLGFLDGKGGPRRPLTR
ncbi:MAG: prolyl oligopeptidase family serine peptidase [Bryobacterales bacterium]